MASSRLAPLDTHGNDYKRRVSEHGVMMSPVAGSKPSPRRFPMHRGRAEVDVVAVVSDTPSTEGPPLFAKVSKTSIVVPTSYADTTKFHFSRVFSDSHNVSAIFKTMAPIVLAPTSGENGAIIAYGQQGVGKSRLMTGTTDSPGLIPRALTELFALRTHGGYILSLSMVEVSPHGVRDLLPAASLAAAGVAEAHVSRREFDKTEVNEVFMAERHQAFTLLHQALRERRRNASKHGCHSHFISVLSLEDSEGARGALYLADLAGITEPRLADKETPTSPRFRKTVSVNSDLLQLERMVRCRAAGDPFMPHSSLTRVLYNAFQPASQVAVMVAVSPREEDRKVTLHALNFGGNATPKAMQGRLASKHITRASPTGSVGSVSPTTGDEGDVDHDPEEPLSLSTPAAASILLPAAVPRGRRGSVDIPDISEQLHHAKEESKLALSHLARLAAQPDIAKATAAAQGSGKHSVRSQTRAGASAPPSAASVASTASVPRSKAYARLEELATLKAKLRSRKDDIHRLESQVSVLLSKREDHEAQLEDAREAVKQLETQVTNLNRKNATLTAKLRSAREKAASADQFSMRLDEKAEALDWRSREVSELLHAAKEERDELMQQLDKANARNKSLRSSLKRSETLQGRHDAEMRRVQQDFLSRLAQVTEQRNVYQEHLQAAKQEMDALHDRIAALKEERKTEAALQDDVKRRMKSMEDELLSERNVTRLEVERAADLDMQLAALKAELAQAQDELAAHRAREARLKADLESEGEHSSNLNKVVRALSDELEVTKGKLREANGRDRSASYASLRSLQSEASAARRDTGGSVHSGTAADSRSRRSSFSLDLSDTEEGFASSASRA